MLRRPKWRFTFDGATYEYHGFVGAPDALLLKAHAGLGTLGLYQGILTGDPGALVGMVFLAKRHAGERVTWDDLVEQMVGDNDLIALIESMEDITDTDEPRLPDEVVEEAAAAEAERESPAAA